jgi:hypothetical protein
MQYILTLTRTTKRTYRYDKMVADEDSELSTLYIQQTAFPGGAPQSITVTIEAN